MVKKNFGKKILAIVLTLTMLLGTLGMSASAYGGGNNHTPCAQCKDYRGPADDCKCDCHKEEEDSSGSYEWYQVYVNGSLVSSGQGPVGDIGWLVWGVYTWSVTISGTTMSWVAGSQSGTVDLTQYITIPEGFTVKSFTATSTEVEGTNTQEDKYDNAIINVTITTLYDEENQEEVPIEEVYPNLEVVKTADKAVYAPGETITWTITVKNTGKAAAKNVVVTDEYTGDSWTIAELAAGASQSFTATSVVPADTADGSQIRNVAVATCSGDTAQDEETVEVDVPVVLYPNIEVTKTADKATYAPGETITWTITVKNTGEAAATNVVVTDEYTGDSWTIAELVAGASQSFTATTTVPADAADGSQIRNVAVAAWDGKETKDEEIVEVETPKYPSIEVAKTSDKAVYAPGETITWTITVKNTGEAAAKNVVVSDEYTNDSWTIAELAVGASQSFSATTIVPADAADGSQIRNVAVATWDGKETKDEEIVEVETPKYPNIEVTKTADKAVYNPGETITWTITVSNTGEAAAKNVVVSDEYTGDSWTIAELAVGEEKSFTATTVVADDAADGSQIRNVAVATWDGKETKDEEIVEVDVPEVKLPNIEVTKTADKAAYAPGETITWTITVKNTGEAAAKNVVVTDEYTNDSWTIAELAADEEKSFTVTTVVPADAADGTQIRNVAVATWDDKETKDEEIVEVETPKYPNIEIVKTADKAVYNPGGTITWTITVKNTGEAAAQNVVVTDEYTDDVWTIAELAVDEEKSFTVTTVVPADAADGSQIRNVAVAIWDDKETKDEEIVEVDVPEVPYYPPVTPDPDPVTPPYYPPVDPEPIDEPIDIPDEEPPLEELPDEDTPLADVPQTGGTLILFGAMTAFSGLGLILMSLKKKSDEE